MSTVENLLASAHHYVANRQYEAALRILVRGVQQFGNIPEVHHQLGLTLAQSGHLKEGRQPIEKAIMLAPHVGLYRANLGRLFMAVRDLQSAERCLQEAIDLDARLPDAWMWLSELQSEQRRYAEAEDSIRRALAIDGRREDCTIFLARLLGQSGRVEAALAVLEDRLRHDPTNQYLLSARAFWLNYLDRPPADIVRAHHQWGAQMASDEPPFFSHRKIHFDPNKRLHLAFISQDFRKHSVAYFMKPWVLHRPQDRVQTSFLYDLHNQDPFTEWFAERVDHFVMAAPWDDSQIMEWISKHHVDILVDLSGHTSNRRWGVFRARPAPLQVTYLGYPNTTGLPQMDARVVDVWTDPFGSENQATETLVRLPSGFLCYLPPDDAPEIQPLPGLTKPLTLGSLNALAKIQPVSLAMWADVLHAIPESRLILKDRALSEESTRQEVLQAFAQLGISAERLTLLDYIDDPRGHLAIYHQIDLALDTYPYHGTTTTCEAMWMGVPTLSRIGDRHASRVGHSLHHKMGQEGFDAQDADEFVRLAVYWSQSREELAELRLGMREKMRMSGLVDGRQWAQEFEEALRELWAVVCEERSG
ncbi:MAG TPA: tetratricopeptide repeat protein [Fimbriimonadaceae bacterium]|nr:tetratricopeptide repeat protein [Fimbriimonadaceae bacterium]HRJ32190.1 tetratricopeptide repeat protein [Fimbriimonadaceae bacterium]